MKLLLIFILSCYTLTTTSKVTAPNYNFSLDKFQDFMPGKTLNEIKKIYPKGLLYNRKNNVATYKYHLTHIRYKFPIFVQFQNGVVTDFFARLPSYFAHNIFHQSLINRIGKQDNYFKYEESAVYTWNNLKGNKHIYFGSCTITCFSVYYTVIKNRKKNEKKDEEYKPILDQFKLNTEPKK